jgi:hypothetical protein
MGKEKTNGQRGGVRKREKCETSPKQQGCLSTCLPGKRRKEFLLEGMWKTRQTGRPLPGTEAPEFVADIHTTTEPSNRTINHHHTSSACLTRVRL